MVANLQSFGVACMMLIRSLAAPDLLRKWQRSLQISCSNLWLGMMSGLAECIMAASWTRAPSQKEDWQLWSLLNQTMIVRRDSVNHVHLLYDI